MVVVEQTMRQSGTLLIPQLIVAEVKVLKGPQGTASSNGSK